MHIQSLTIKYIRFLACLCLRVNDTTINNSRGYKLSSYIFLHAFRNYLLARLPGLTQIGIDRVTLAFLKMLFCRPNRPINQLVLMFCGTNNMKITPTKALFRTKAWAETRPDTCRPPNMDWLFIWQVNLRGRSGQVNVVEIVTYWILSWKSLWCCFYTLSW